MAGEKKDKNYINRMQAMQQRRRGVAKGDKLSAAAQERQDKIENRVGKALIIPENEMIKAIKNNTVPTMMKHCVLAVMKKKKRKLPGSEKEQFLSAFNICAATFAKHGHFTRRGSLNMSGKGARRNRCHQREKVAGTKKGRYNGLVNKLWTAQLTQARFSSKEDRRQANNARDRMARMRKRRQTGEQ